MSAPRRREKDGAGKSDHSWEKHYLMRKALGAQLGKALMLGLVGQSAAIVDMHAHDGSDAMHPQQDLFDGNAGTCSASLAVTAAQKHSCDVFLCESMHDRRTRLKDRFGHGPKYLRSFNLLTKVDWTRYEYVVVLNDPNGHSKHGLDVMQHIARQRGVVSDFLIMVNEASVDRSIGLLKNNVVNLNEDPKVRAARNAAKHIEWLLQPEEWRRRLWKREVASSHYLTNGAGYRGRMIVASNGLANLSHGVFKK